MRWLFQRVFLASLFWLTQSTALFAQNPSMPQGNQPTPNWSPGDPVLPQPVQIPQPGQIQGLPPPPPSPYNPNVPYQGVPAVPAPVLPETNPIGVNPIPVPVVPNQPELRPGLFSAFEIGVFVPHLSTNLAGYVPVGDSSQYVNLPFIGMNWTGSPHSTLGYRFPEGVGSVLISYRSLVTDGGQNFGTFDTIGEAFLKTRINLNSGDILFASPHMQLNPYWDMKWNLGLRIAGVYTDTLATGMTQQQRATSNFVGAGPKVGFDFHRHIPAFEGLSLFGRLEGGVVVGEVHQSFAISQQFPDGSTTGGASNLSDSQSVPVLGLQLGLSFSKRRESNWFRFSTGYQFEQWWGVGSVGNSNADLQFQGFFFRGEFNY